MMYNHRTYYYNNIPSMLLLEVQVPLLKKYNQKTCHNNNTGLKMMPVKQASSLKNDKKRTYGHNTSQTVLLRVVLVHTPMMYNYETCPYSSNYINSVLAILREL